MTINIAKAAADEIGRRADALHLTPSTYAAIIVEKWVADGCPPVTEPDRLLQIAKAEKPARKVS